MSEAPSSHARSWLGWMFPPAPIRIDTATREDIPPLAQIHAASFPHDWSVDELASLVSEPHVICLVAKRANALGTRSPMGFLLLRLAADEAEVLTIAVDPRRRGRGYGAALMTAGVDRLIRRGIVALFLEVDVANLSAVQLYRRLGFIQVGERNGYYRNGTAEGSMALIMRLDLS
jgi:ribosomal-protein-alanine N-acetyltransferase